MLTAFWTLLLGSPVKLALWAGNRVATWMGLFFMWRRLKGDPNRWRTFLIVGGVINLLSLGVLAAVLWALKHRGAG